MTQAVLSRAEISQDSGKQMTLTSLPGWQLMELLQTTSSKAFEIYLHVTLFPNENLYQKKLLLNMNMLNMFNCIKFTCNWNSDV